MADEIYAQVIACGEAFDVWWPKARADFLVDGNDLERRRLAQAAWRAAWDARGEHENLEPGSDEPESRDWEKISKEVCEASKIAMRNSLVISSVPGANDKRVEAWRNGPKPVYVQVNGWAEMIHVLKDMEKRGAL